MIGGTSNRNVQEEVEENAEFHVQKYEVDLLYLILLSNKAKTPGYYIIRKT